MKGYFNARQFTSSIESCTAEHILLSDDVNLPKLIKELEDYICDESFNIFHIQSLLNNVIEYVKIEVSKGKEIEEVIREYPEEVKKVILLVNEKKLSNNKRVSIIGCYKK